LFVPLRTHPGGTGSPTRFGVKSLRLNILFDGFNAQLSGRLSRFIGHVFYQLFDRTRKKCAQTIQDIRRRVVSLLGANLRERCPVDAGSGCDFIKRDLASSFEGQVGNALL